MKPTKKELIRHLKKLKIPTAGRQCILRIYEKNVPSRVPSGGGPNIHDTVSSRKAGYTRNSEAHHTELPFLFWCEFSKHVLLYYDQPDPIRISYRNKDGKKVTLWITCDFLVITDTEVFFVECKRQDWLEKAIVEQPFKYSKQADRYTYPPAMESAQELGFNHYVVTDRDFPTPFTRNCRYLWNYIDDLADCDSELGQTIRSRINTMGHRIRLSELNKAFGDSHIIKLIYHQHLFVDFNRELLCYPEQTWVYADSEFLEAWAHLKKAKQLLAVDSLRQLNDVTHLWWLNKKYEVIHASLAPSFSMKIREPGKQMVCLSEAEFNRLLENQEIYIEVNPSQDKTDTILMSKNSRQIRDTKVRLASINPASRTKANVSERTLYRWKAKAKSSDDPFLALLDNSENRGNREPRVCPVQLKLQQELFQQLLQPSPPSVTRVYESFKAECAKRQLKPCTYVAFNNRFNKFSKYYRTLKQKGFKAAYALGPTPREIDLAWTLPTEGDFIFEIVHIDHTPVEITLVSKLTGEALEGTLNLSMMYDTHSQVILAVYISFEKPSYRATMMLLRECYRRYQRLPIWIVVDHGPDFESVYFDSTLAELGVNKRRRPKSASRAGSPIERAFGISENELIHCLKGNKQLQKLGRGLSNSHRSEKYAIWTPDAFDSLLKDYAYLVNPQKNRRGISETPQTCWDRSALKFDSLPGTKVISDTAFKLAVLPDVDRDGTRTLRKNQLEFRGINYQLSKQVAGYGGERLKVQTKYDPYDLSYILICLKDRWVKMSTTDRLVRECLDKGVQLAHMEVMSRKLRNSRRKHQNVEHAVKLNLRQEEQEQYHFNLKQSQLGAPILPQDREAPEPFQIDASNFQILPATPLRPKGDHNE